MLRSSRLPSPLSRGARSARPARPAPCAPSRLARICLQPRDLLLAHHHVVDLAGSRSGLPSSSLYLLTPTITSLPESMRACFSAAAASIFSLAQPRVDGLGHAAHGLDFLDDLPGRVGHVLRQLLHHVAAGPGVDHVGDVGLFLDDQLRVARDARAELGGQRDRLVEASWCAATACRRTPRPSPRWWCARRCCTGPARSATSPRSGSACAASGSWGSSASKPFMIRHHSRRAARILATSR